MNELEKRGHQIELQENLAMKRSSPEQYTYLFARLKYRLRFSLQFSSSYDVIFASKPEIGVLAYMLSQKTGTPFVLDLDDLEGINVLDRWRCGTSFLVRKAVKTFVASKELYKIYSKVRNDIVYLPNTTNLGYFDPKKYENIERSDKPTFIWVGGIKDKLAKSKLILLSFAKLKIGRLYIMGKLGNYQKRYCSRLSRELGIENRVVIKSWIPEEEVPKMYKASDIGLLPFMKNPWTQCKCPSRLLEFIAMELPFICTVGEPAYMARKLGCGVVSKPELGDFTKKLEYAIDHLEELKKKAKEARKYLLQRQNLNSLAEKLEHELESTI